MTPLKMGLDQFIAAGWGLAAGGQKAKNHSGSIKIIAAMLT